MRSTSELQATLRPPGKLSQPMILGLLGERMIKTTKPSGDGLVKVTFSLPTNEPAGAVSVVGDFGVAMYCGFGRQPGADGTETMREHARVVREVRLS